MVIRSIVIAVLFAGAASAQANPTPSAHTLGGWTLESGSVSVVGALNSIDTIVASGNWAAFSQAWSMHTSLSAHGAASGNSAVLFAPNATGGMSGVGFAGGGGDVGAGGSGGTGGTIIVGGGGGGGIGGGGDGGIDLEAGIIGGDTGGGLDALEPIAAAAVPEPGSIALLLAGLLGAGMATRRRSR